MLNHEHFSNRKSLGISVFPLWCHRAPCFKLDWSRRPRRWAKTQPSPSRTLSKTSPDDRYRRNYRYRTIPRNWSFVGPRRPCEHAHLLQRRWVHRLYHTSTSRRDGDAVSCGRIVQCVHNSLFLSGIWICIGLELLVQWCCFSCFGLDCCSVGTTVLECRTRLDSQRHLLDIPSRRELVACGRVRGIRYDGIAQILIIFRSPRLPEYWLSSLKIATVVLFIIVGTFVNVGFNTEHTFIGLSNWKIPGAPFVGGIGGFARVFVTASFACAFFFLWYLVTIIFLYKLLKSFISRRDWKLGYYRGRNEESF